MQEQGRGDRGRGGIFFLRRGETREQGRDEGTGKGTQQKEAKGDEEGEYSNLIQEERTNRVLGQIGDTVASERDHCNKEMTGIIG